MKIDKLTNLVDFGIRELQKHKKVKASLNGNKSTQEIQAKNFISQPTASSASKQNNGALTQTVSLQAIAKQPNQTQDEIPALQKNDEIRGRRGRYRVQSESPIKTLDRVRFYEGIQIISNKPVLIKEYLLSEVDFNQKELKDSKEEFDELSSIKIKAGGGQDFRLVIPWDAIAPRHERRCYIITEPIKNSKTLKDYLEQTNRPMTSHQVREFLKQTLQTLWFLHNQKVRFPNGEVRYDLPHGNLSLDSILISTTEEKPLIESEQFFIYLSDLSIWEDLFIPPNSRLISPLIAKDLKDLGYVSFYLWLGGDKDSKLGLPLDPKNEKDWSRVDDTFLKNFIQRLIGIEPPFTNAEEARKALLSAPPPQPEEQVENIKKEEKQKPPQNSQLLVLQVVVISLLLGFLGTLLIGWIFSRNLGTNPGADGNENEYNKYSKINGVPDQPSGEFKYAATEVEGTWNSLIYRKLGNNNKRTSLVSFGKTFEQELRDRGMKLGLNYSAEPSIDGAFMKLNNQSYDFLIISLLDTFVDSLKARNFNYQTFAYDGIVIYVPYSDSQRKVSLSQALNGKINFEQLRKLYTGEITNWSQLGNNFPNLPIKLYIPEEKEVVNRFKDAVFKNYPEEAKRFEQLIQQRKITIQDTRTTLAEKILRDFEQDNNAIGGIGFGLLSKVFNQCSVYPLSAGEPGREVQTLVQNNGEDINPKLDLCNDKGSYRPNVDVFAQKRYSLGYEIAVVYPDQSQDSKAFQAGSKLAEILQTDEGQDLLKEAGLVPTKKQNNEE